MEALGKILILPLVYKPIKQKYLTISISIYIYKDARAGFLHISIHSSHSHPSRLQEENTLFSSPSTSLSQSEHRNQN